MSVMSKFRDKDGTSLGYGDTVVIVVGGLPIGRLARGEVVDIGVDYIEIFEEITKESFFVYKSEQVLYLYS